MTDTANPLGWTWASWNCAAELRERHLRELMDLAEKRSLERIAASDARAEARAQADTTALDVAVKATKAALEVTAAESQKEFATVRVDIKDLQRVIADGLAALKLALESRTSEGVGAEKLRGRDLRLISAGGALVGVVGFLIWLFTGAHP